MAIRRFFFLFSVGGSYSPWLAGGGVDEGGRE
jgi:hypothetical protein